MTKELLCVWYRSFLPDGRLWCETIRRSELLEDHRDDLTYEVLHVYRLSEGWQPYDPKSAPDTPDWEPFDPDDDWYPPQEASRG
jgi:hypothetical protein